VAVLALQACSPSPGGPDAGKDAGEPDAGPVDSGTKDAGPPKGCVGGVITADGGCAGKCTPNKCLPGNTCVGNACTLKCSSHLDCLFSQRCAASHEDDSDAGIFVCTDIEFRGVGNVCPNGNECAPGYDCITSGPADAKAYCASGCLGDSDCPGGFECGYKRDSRPICGTTKGNNSACGLTSNPCIDRVNITPASGYVEGTICLQRRVCLKRDVCSSCTSDVDCSLYPSHSCVPLGAEKRCKAACSKNTDCEADKYCDEGFCTPMTGKCGGSGFCSPCRYDFECEPDMACVALHGSEKSCIDLRFSKQCVVDNDCPAAPSGLHGACLDQRQGVDTNSSVFHRCYAPYDEENSSYSCYKTR
jgi:hypothetical protein